MPFSRGLHCPITTKSFLFCRWLRMEVPNMNGNNMFLFPKQQACVKINSSPSLNNALMMVKYSQYVNGPYCNLGSLYLNKAKRRVLYSNTRLNNSQLKNWRMP